MKHSYYSKPTLLHFLHQTFLGMLQEKKEKKRKMFSSRWTLFPVTLPLSALRFKCPTYYFPHTTKDLSYFGQSGRVQKVCETTSLAACSLFGYAGMLLKASLYLLRSAKAKKKERKKCTALWVLCIRHFFLFFLEDRGWHAGSYYTAHRLANRKWACSQSTC